MVNSEMGHLFYISLENLGATGTDGTIPQPGWGLENLGPFEHLEPLFYWSGTGYSLIPAPGNAWVFDCNEGSLIFTIDTFGEWLGDISAMAVRPGEVTFVPIPGAAFLLFTGLIGFAGLRSKRLP